MSIDLCNKMFFLSVLSFLLLPAVSGCNSEKKYPQGNSRATNNRTSVDELCRIVADSNIQNIEQVREFLDLGISPNTTDKKGSTPLTCAIASGKTNIAAYLIERGAHVEHVTSAGETPLHVACSSDDGTWAVRLLVAKGANINRPSDIGTTPLMWAAQWGFEETAQVLLELGADVSKTNRLGQTAAELAWMFGHQTLAKKILESQKSESIGKRP
jgi:ankyrin repeat protein